jgi:hypothetical protein
VLGIAAGQGWQGGARAEWQYTDKTHFEKLVQPDD